ncbi:DUF58 domain-containing protein [Rosistilla oblonga]|uniref:DUF58 domain-containing protein n=1 Tax=Rosistilla oblonga TaxID=2527990 RepID=UPI003A9754A5
MNAAAPPADSRQAASEGSFKWIALGAAVLLVGMLFGSSLLLYTAYSAIAVVAVSRWLTNTWSVAPRAHRVSGPLEAEIGQVVPIEIEIQNTGKVLIPWLLAEDLLPRDALLYKVPALQIEGDRIRVISLSAGETDTIRYEIKCNRRGYYQIGPTVLETGDLMGLNRRYRVGAVPQYLLVMPRVVPLHGYDIQSRRPIGEIRMSHPLMDDPTRIVGIRQWQPGDPMRRVHWSATARTGELHSKIYEASSIAGATLVIDLHRDTNPRQHEPVRSELAITLAASISNALYQMNQPFGLVSNGRDAADRIRTEGFMTDYRTRDAATQHLKMHEVDAHLKPVCLSAQRGPVHYRDVHRMLARLEITDGLNLSQTFLEVESRLSRDTTLIVIVQECDSSTAEVLAGFKRRGWAVTAIINTFEVDDYSKAAGPLVASGIAVMQLRDEASLAMICRALVER